MTDRWTHAGWTIRCPRCGKRHARGAWLRLLERLDRIHCCRQCGKLFPVCGREVERSPRSE